MKLFIHNILLSLTTITFLAACRGGSGGDTSNGGTTSQSGLPSDINGLMVFDMYDSGQVGIFALELGQGNVINKRRLSHQYPYAYDRNTIVFAQQNCGAGQVFRINTMTEKGLVSSNDLTPCSNSISGFSILGLNKLSPDKSKLAVEVQFGLGPYRDVYAILVYDMNSNMLIKRYDNYGFPEWHPDGRLLMSPKGVDATETGIYMTDISFTRLERFDRPRINQEIAYSDISPSGKQVVFSMGAQIWLMDINGDNLQELIADEYKLTYPTWSPDGQYIAYLTNVEASGYKPLNRLSFFHLTSKNSYHLDTNTVLPERSGLGYVTPIGPLSWVR